ncbi:MAG: hypothetical protein ACREBU_26555, partial [Nitrososphaera sp.]
MKGRKMLRNCQYALTISCVAALVLTTGWLHTAAAQENQSQQMSRKWGIGATFQGGQPFIIVPVWLTQRIAVGPIVSATHTENVNLNYNTGVGARIYPTIARIAPFWGAAVIAAYNKPQRGGATTSPAWAFGGYFGGEFFINQRFSLIVQPGVWILRPSGGGNM